MTSPHCTPHMLIQLPWMQLRSPLSRQAKSTINRSTSPVVWKAVKIHVPRFKYSKNVWASCIVCRGCDGGMEKGLSWTGERAQLNRSRWVGSDHRYITTTAAACTCRSSIPVWTKCKEIQHGCTCTAIGIIIRGTTQVRTKKQTGNCAYSQDPVSAGTGDIHVMWAVSCELCHVSCVMWAVSCELCHVSCVMWAVSCELCHVSCVMWAVMWAVSCELCHVSYVMWAVSCELCHVSCYDVPCNTHKARRSSRIKLT